MDGEWIQRAEPIRKAIAKNETQRNSDEIELDERQRKRMEVIREFIESKSHLARGEDSERN